MFKEKMKKKKKLDYYRGKDKSARKSAMEIIDYKKEI